MKCKQKIGFWLCLAAALLLTVGAASAAPAQSFEALLGEYGLDAADAQVQTHCMTVEESTEAMGARISVEGVYFDGERLLIGWRTNNLAPEQPVLVLYTDVRIGGVSLGNEAYADYPISAWWPQVFGLSVTGDPINDLMDAYDLEQAQDYDLQGTQEVSVYFTVKRPIKPLVVVDADVLTPCADADAETDRQSMLAAMDDCGVSIALSDELDAQTWMDKGYLVVNQGGELLNAEGTTNDMAALNGEDLTDADIADVTLTFTVDFDALAGK
ncbi:MAG TPA: hypothetical protein PK537_12340 [Candidatus Limiplasma sp.]|nr:hypothetical protein [Candidatus Limiplasma sp.]